MLLWRLVLAAHVPYLGYEQGEDGKDCDQCAADRQDVGGAGGGEWAGDGGCDWCQGDAAEGVVGGDAGELFGGMSCCMVVAQQTVYTSRLPPATRAAARSRETARGSRRHAYRAGTQWRKPLAMTRSLSLPVARYRSPARTSSATACRLPGATSLP
jgi:hypothetical protein